MDQEISTPTKSLKPKLSTLDSWISQGIPCYYVRLQSPVAPARDKEPVSEFYIKGPTGKYLIDSMWYTPYGLVWRAHKETNITALANIVLSRILL
jgi:hypothetical protein